MATQPSPKTRKLPHGWEKRIDYSTDIPYYVDHNTKTTHWHPPPPKLALPPVPPNNLRNKQALSPSSNAATLSPNHNKPLPTTGKTHKPTRKTKHYRAGTVGSRTAFEWKMDDLKEVLQPISDAQISAPTQPISAHQLRRKSSKPYSKDTIDNYDTHSRYIYVGVGRRLPTKPMAPPNYLKKRPSARNTILIKPPPIYTKKYMTSTAIPPPPPRSIPTPPSKLDCFSIQQATSFEATIKSDAKLSIKATLPPHRGALLTAAPITPKHVERFTTGQRDISHSVMPPISTSTNSIISKPFYRNKRVRNTMAINKELPPLNINTPNTFNTDKRANTPEAISKSKSNTKKQTREKRTLTGSRFVKAAKWGGNSNHITTVKFSKYKKNFAVKYDEKRKKLKEKLKEKKSSIKADILEYKKKRNSLRVHSEYLNGENSIESVSISHSLSTPLPGIKDEEEEKAEECRFLSLYEIVELVTSPRVRGTQHQTILLRTYCLYTSRQELLDVIFKRLTATSCDNKQQIKVLSLLRTWLKIENDFRDVLDDNFNLNTSVNLAELSPTPSVPDPPLKTKTAAACVPADIHSLNIIKDDAEINTFDDKPSKPSLSPFAYTFDDKPMHKLELSPFAAYFRRVLMSNTCSNAVLNKLAAPILSQLCTDKGDHSANLRDRTLSFADAPTPKIPKIKDAKDLSLHKMSCIEVARQICLLEYAIFKKIKAEEFLTQKTTKQKKLELQNQTMKIANSAHNLSSDQLRSQLKTLQKEKNDKLEKESMQININKMTDWFNRLVVWSQIEILYERDIHKRCKIISQILKICDCLERYNNISSLCAIRAGLCSAPIHRLRKTWQHIPKKAKDIKCKIDELFKLGNGQKQLRDRIAIISQPAIPHLGLFLADIVFIHDGNATFDQLDEEEEGDKNKINWSKMKLLADRINWISMFQQSPFIFQSVPIIVTYLQSKMKILPQDFLYKLSREVEPPDKKK